MHSGPQSHLRIARPCRDLAAAERFWVDGLGLRVLWRSAAEDEHALLMLGWPDAAWHVELVQDPDVVATPTEEDLLVLYVGTPLDDDLEPRLVAAGGTRVTARNAYWDTWGLTIQDPDGYRLVLSHRTWDSAAAARATANHPTPADEHLR